jgi:hypothetical protein
VIDPYRKVPDTGIEIIENPLPSAALIEVAKAIYAWVSDEGPEPDVRGWRYDPHADPRNQQEPGA